MTAPAEFKAIDGAAWAKALTAARQRRNGQGKRILEAIKAHDAKNKTCAKSLQFP
jgi:hypothetical protein